MSTNGKTQKFRAAKLKGFTVLLLLLLIHLNNITRTTSINSKNITMTTSINSEYHYDNIC